ncbi:DNA alkylation repair protein [Pararhodospirillum oryzae]|uniref:DNA alkylation repair protein n=1 Tax=Pararhodospirillum oryzae TaxID=478448 RepID=A0A512HC06_9PROT|nr:DNA alkylation repair protein [Pararhodospirillum oryzae]GEO82973.1 DNA alkylation repair protein [Pararhodospirillum oryzae]
MSKEKGARGCVKEIDPARLARLNAGEVEAATLTECLAVDFTALMSNILPEIGTDALADMELGAATGISKRMSLAARLIRKNLGDTVVDRLGRHPSDTVRGWACFMIGAAEMPLPDRLAAIRPYADDLHFGVREWSWLAVRPHLARDLESTIAVLTKWTAASSERVRRFASEAIRPRGVWCAHITALKEQPWAALSVLEPLRADPSAYVQNSVGNWLNDAGKDQPDWVQALCARWSTESPAGATAHICKRALRSINPDL